MVSTCLLVFVAVAVLFAFGLCCGCVGVNWVWIWLFVDLTNLVCLLVGFDCCLPGGLLFGCGCC